MVLPVGGDLNTEFIAESQTPSKTYKINTETGTISGYIDGAESVAQAVWKMLSTERFAYLIYSSDYGITLHDLIGKPRGFVEAEIERRIKDTLFIDDRVTDVRDVTFESKDDLLVVNFVVDTIFGPLEKAVEYRV